MPTNRTKPVTYHADPSGPPVGHPLSRGWHAIVLERRLPYQITQRLDRWLPRVGFPFKTMRAGDYRVRVRRGTVDERFVINMLEREDYFAPGYRPSPTDVVIDVGGNIGAFALAAARYASAGRVISIEPERDNFALLEHNIVRNGARHVSAIRAAVSDTPGSLRLYRNRGGGGFHSVLPERAPDPTDFEDVPAITLANVMTRYNIDCCHFLKLDCEGAEYAILYAIPPALFARIDRIVLEYHGDRDATKRLPDAERLVAHLEQIGYQIDTFIDYADFDCGLIRAKRT